MASATLEEDHRAAGTGGWHERCFELRRGGFPMRTFVKALVLSFGLAAFGSAHAFSGPVINAAQKQNAKLQIRAMVPNVKRITFGFGKHEPGFIGRGLEDANVLLKNGRKLQFALIPNGPTKVKLIK
jgi:hypothetical protein